MRLIFIRHGDPDYSIDNLTEKGKKEVALLTERICKWDNITDFFTSPLGRAKATGAPALEKLGRTAKEFPWLQEFYYQITVPKDYPDKSQVGKKRIAWDLLPDYYLSHPEFFDKDKWLNSKLFKNSEIKEKYKEMCKGIDGLLAEYGYIRNKKGFYDVENPVPNRNWADPVPEYHLTSVKNDYNEDKTLVFFCHLGVMFAIISHLTSLSPMQLWQGFYVAPTSITILNSEERLGGQAWFRVERLGDTNHLTNGGEPISSSGYFASVLGEKPSII